jgi:hypothetical protein
MMQESPSLHPPFSPFLLLCHWTLNSCIYLQNMTIGIQFNCKTVCVQVTRYSRRRVWCPCCCRPLTRPVNSQDNCLWSRKCCRPPALWSDWPVLTWTQVYNFAQQLVGGQDSVIGKPKDQGPKGTEFNPRLHRQRCSTWATASFCMWDNKDLLSTVGHSPSNAFSLILCLLACWYAPTSMYYNGMLTSLSCVADTKLTAFWSMILDSNKQWIVSDKFLSSASEESKWSLTKLIHIMHILMF